MRLVFISQHYPPENSGNASRVSDTAETLARLGAKVTVLCPHPTFPTGTFRRRWRWRERNTRNGVEVVHLWGWQPSAKDPGFLSRVAYYLTFPLHALLWALTHRRAYDVIIGSTPPLFTSFPGWIISGLFKDKRIVVEVRDLWIDAAVGLGFIRETSPSTKLARWFEGSCYRRADLIAVTTPDVAAKIRRRYVGITTRTEVVPNGVDTAKFDVRQASKKTQFLYAGNIGHAQDLETVIAAIGLVREEYPEVKLVIAGAGDTRDELEAFVRSSRLEETVSFPGIVPRELVAALYAESLAGLAPLKNNVTLEYAVPTKAYEALGCGVPFIGTGVGEIRRLATASGGGIIAENSPESISQAMKWVIEHPTEAAIMAASGRAFVTENYDRRKIAAAYFTQLRQLGEGRS